jgi:hypothetical protein
MRIAHLIEKNKSLEESSIHELEIINKIEGT